MDKTTSFANLIGRDSMTDAHLANFIAAIRKGGKLEDSIAVGNFTVITVQLSNIDWEGNRELRLDTKDRRSQGDPETMRMLGRECEPGWPPHV